jgi:predicted TIM-barrel enzyme
VVAAVADSQRARQLQAAGIDALVAYHSSVYRAAGLPSVAGLLPWANANEQTLAVLPAVLAGAAGVPVYATVSANDRLVPAELVLSRIVASGAAGVLNAPTVGLLTGEVRDELERAGLGFDCELELVRAARERGLGAMTYVFDGAQAERAAADGATVLVAHFGITRPGAAVEDRHLDLLAAVCRAGRSSGVPVLAHGGPLADPARLAQLRAAAGLPVGFFGASVFDTAAQPDVTAWRPGPTPS